MACPGQGNYPIAVQDGGNGPPPVSEANGNIPGAERPLLRAKLCLCPCFRHALPPGQAGLTPPSSGPHTAGRKHSSTVFWNLLEGLVQEAGPSFPGLAWAYLTAAGKDSVQGKGAALGREPWQPGSLRLLP